MSTKITPILKWAGGKRQLLPVITPNDVPKQFHTYYEPFIIRRVLYFATYSLHKPVINDVNKQPNEYVCANQRQITGLKYVPLFQK